GRGARPTTGTPGPRTPTAQPSARAPPPPAPPGARAPPAPAPPPLTRAPPPALAPAATAHPPPARRPAVAPAGRRRARRLPPHPRIQLLSDDGRARPTVVDAVAQLRFEVHRVDRNDDRVRAQDRVVADDELRAVLQIEQHAIAAPHAGFVLQPSGNALDLVEETREADARVVENQVRLVGIAFGGNPGVVDERNLRRRQVVRNAARPERTMPFAHPAGAGAATLISPPPAACCATPRDPRRSSGETARARCRRGRAPCRCSGGRCPGSTADGGRTPAAEAGSRHRSRPRAPSAPGAPCAAASRAPSARAGGAPSA